MNQHIGSDAVRTMSEAAAKTWRAWRKHVEAGTAESPEALTLWEESQLAGSVLLNEIAGRTSLTEARRNAAVADSGPTADLGLMAACEQARAA